MARLQVLPPLMRPRVLPALLVATLSWTGCGGDPSPSSPADACYRVQGVVQRVAGDQRGYREIVVRHQSVAEFRNREGEVVGMESMAMPFAVAPGIALDVLAPQDPVEMTFEVRWNGDPVLLITDLAELPAGTEVDFTTPVPVGDPGASAEDDSPEHASEPTVDPDSSTESAALGVRDEDDADRPDDGAI